ncbi:hypothetical protein [Pseudomonas chlororaphis]|uniref:hypothetical protein n=1 Tax=Pseudomonas chlororaphis TaxID=587753 RepID=UPI0018E9FAED|nr:hypothetical protein [Pseudomonas chlororaphis]
MLGAHPGYSRGYEHPQIEFATPHWPHPLREENLTNALKMNVLVHRFMFMDREWRALAQFPHTTTRFLRLLGAALFLAVSPLSLVRRFFLILEAGKGVVPPDAAEPLIKGSSRNSGKHRNKNADLIDDVRASKHI